MKSIQVVLIFLATLVINDLIAQKKNINYYLPDIEYDKKITTPEDFLGHQIGEWHISHDQLLSYVKLIANQSDRVEFVETGRTHENRPLCVLHISSEENLRNKEKIRQKHILLTEVENSQTVDIRELPLVLYQGYSIHGNEASGANAAPLVLYYLAAGKGKEINELLEKVYILFDPSYNPDGLQRFSSWVNSHKGINLISDPQSREFNEAWPRGRTNHYWFDLNRDWLLLTHPESKARVNTFHQWKPNILTDHHEMGTNSTFFFQPGVPSRTNPNTPWKNQELTEKIGTFHAKALDAIGSQYFTKEQYDDFYYGKGSTYPDIHGSIGILFEQASARGHLQESENGLLSFPFAIRNQVVTSLSTQKAAVELREELIEFKREFYQIKHEESQQNQTKGYLFTDSDLGKLARFSEILSKHDISLYSVVGKDNQIVVPLSQKQYGLIKTIFEEVKSFNDSIFYDVSAWTMPLAFDLEFKALAASDLQDLNIKPLKNVDHLRQGKLVGSSKNPYSWIFDWSQHESPTLLQRLLSEGLLCRVSTKKINVETSEGNKELGEGAIIIPSSNQNKDLEDIRSMLEAFSEEAGIIIYEIETGYGKDGNTTGNPSIQTIKKPSYFTIVGDGISSYDAGELWHYMDQTLGAQLTMVDVSDLTGSNLQRYSTLVLVNGSYRTIDKKGVAKIKKWIDNGGNVVSWRGGTKFLKDSKLINLTSKARKEREVHPVRQYQGSSKARGAQVLGGAIFKGRIDLSHPLAFGYKDEEIPLFRKGTTFYVGTKNRYATPIKYAEDPLYSGYVPRGIDKFAENCAAATVHEYGEGTIVAFSDNLLFRGYWWGTHRLFANALFFSDIINWNSKEKPKY